MKKFTIWAILFLFLSISVFYFWAGSASTEASSYYRVEENKQELHPITKSDTLRIASYNVGYFSGMTNNLPVKRSQEFFDENAKIISSLIRKLDADILTIQEVDFAAKRSFYVDQLEEIVQKNRYRYSARAVNWDKNYVPFPYFPFDLQFGKTVSGQAIASRYPILKHRVEKLITPLNAAFWYTQFYLDRLLQICEINVGQPLIVMNLHLEAFDKETREIQAEAVVEIVKEYMDKYPVLLSGDFNSPLPLRADETTLNTIIDKLNLKEAIPDSIYLMGKEKGTFPTDKPRYKIDHIFYHPDQIQAISWEVPDSLVSASDHKPILFEFKIKEN